MSLGLDYFVFPAMTETVLNSCGGVDVIPLILDSGASCCISPCQEDFCPDYTVTDVKITDLTRSRGRAFLHGILRLSMARRLNLSFLLPGYHVPYALICLLSPPSFMSANYIGGGHGIQDESKIASTSTMVSFLMLLMDMSISQFFPL